MTSFKKDYLAGHLRMKGAETEFLFFNFGSSTTLLFFKWQVEHTPL